MMKNQLLNILSSAQVTRASHQRKLLVLKRYYEEVHQDQFFEQLSNALSIIFCESSLPTKNEYVERTLEFLAQFISIVTPPNDKEDDFIQSTPNHPFLTGVIVETLKYQDLTNHSLRYNSCLFVRLVLDHIGCDINLDNDLCDMVERAMLQRTADSKFAIRHQAILALLRLQDPTNPECPVIKAFLSLIGDSNPVIRAEVVKIVAPNIASIPLIIKRLQDVDGTVRLTAYRRCADLGPTRFKIVERQRIIQCGLSETLPKIKKVFVEKLLSKWLHDYDENFITLLCALKLDADENDIFNTEFINKEVMELLYCTIPMKKVVDNLPLDENKLIPLKELSIEVVNLWNITVNHLRDHEDVEEYLDDLLPELTAFCSYIERLISRKKKNMEEWEYLSYQHIVHKLLEIVEGYDFSDEVGRKNLYELSIKILREENFQNKVQKKLICLAAELTPTTEDFTTVICPVISEMLEPSITKIIDNRPASFDTDLECRKAELKVKIIKLESELEDVIDRKEFSEAATIKTDIDKLRVKLKELDVSRPMIEVVTDPNDDPRKICDCLDIIIALLELPRIRTMTPSLVKVKDDFVMPLVESDVAEVNWRVLNCLALMCVLDGKLAEEYIKIICIPIITYREVPIDYKQPLIIAIKSVSDLYRIHGGNIFGSVDDTTNMTVQKSQTKRRLYQNDDADESNAVAPNRFHLDSIIEIMLDMLDDESAEIRNASGTAILKLIVNNFPVTPLFLARIVLKWYNPLTVKGSDRLQHVLGVLLETYASKIPEARQVIAKAVIPILRSVASAPATSPLTDVDVDNLISFLAVITNSNGTQDLANTHLDMAHMLCYEMMQTKNTPIVHQISKLLLQLNIPPGNDVSIKELILQVEFILQEENILDKMSHRCMSKFLQKLRSCLESHTGVTTLETINEETETSNSNTPDDNSNANEIERNVENREPSTMNKAVSDKESDSSRVDTDNIQNSHCRTEASLDLSHNNNSTVETVPTENDKKRTRTKPKHQRTEETKSVDNSSQIRSVSSTDSEAEESCLKRANKKLKVCLSRFQFGDIGNAEDHKTPEQTNENILSDEASSCGNRNLADGNVGKSNIEKHVQTEKNTGVPAVCGDANEPMVGNSKRKKKSSKVTKNHQIGDNPRNGNESGSSSDMEQRRVTKRLKIKIQKLENNVNESVGSQTSGRPPNSQNTTDQGPSKHGPSNQGLSKRGPSKRGPSKRGPSKQGPSNQRPSKQGPSKQGPSKQGPSKQGPSKQGPSKQGPSKQEPSYQGPSKQGPSKQGPSKQGPSKQGPSKQEPSYQGPSKQGPSKQGPSKQEPSYQGPSKQGPSKQGPSYQGPSNQRPSRYHSIFTETNRRASSNLHNTTISSSKSDDSLHTIVYDTSQISVMQDVSSFGSSNETVNSQRSTRSSLSTTNVPSSKGKTNKITTPDESPSNGESRRRSKKNKTKKTD